MDALHDFIISPPGIIAVVFGAAVLLLTAIKFSWDLKARLLDRARQRPGVQATINRNPSVDRWRSVQIALLVPEAYQNDRSWNFTTSGWRIRNAKLIWPRTARIAFAREDDASLRGPISASSGNLMSGRIDDRQPFVMEFFLRLPQTPEHDQGKRAKFRVTVWRKSPYEKGFVRDVWAEVPSDASSKRND